MRALIVTLTSSKTLLDEPLFGQLKVDRPRIHLEESHFSKLE